MAGGDVPLILRGAIDWKQLKWSLDDWQEALDTADDNTKYPVRKGYTHCSQEPHWERGCETREVSMSELFGILKAGKSEEQEDCWYYFDYKHLAQWFADSNVLQDICWDAVGYPDKTGKDSTLWIGTRGAHTPCHADSYGCNVVAQLYGRKMWLLFPPEETENLKPTRVPYEESSVYSGINFACGCNSSVQGIGHVRKVVLEPGDVLFVPNKWWHYVENLSTAISVNVWVPLESDNESRLEESLAKCVVSAFTAGLSTEDRTKLLNPNEDDLSPTVDLSEVSWCLKRCAESERRAKNEKGRLPWGNETAGEVPPVPVESLRAILKAKCRTGAAAGEQQDSTGEKPIEIGALIDAFCHPDVLKIVRKKLQSSHS